MVLLNHMVRNLGEPSMSECDMYLIEFSFYFLEIFYLLVLVGPMDLVGG